LQLQARLLDVVFYTEPIENCAAYNVPGGGELDNSVNSGCGASAPVVAWLSDR
jgi:hypothetical protein